MAGIGETLIGLAAGAGLNLASSDWQTRKQIKAQKELIDYQNRYNSPVNQMRLYKEAGLSPALVAASGASGGQVSPSASPGSVPVDPNSGSALVSAASGFGTNLANLQLLNAQCDNLKADTLQKLANADLTKINTQIEQLRIQFLPQMFSNELSLQELEQELKRSGINLNSQQIRKLVEETANVRKQRDIMDNELALYVENIRKAKSEADIAEMRKRITPQQLQAELDKVIADKQASFALANQLAAVAANVNKDTEVKEVQRQIQDIILGYTDQQQNLQTETARTQYQYNQNVLQRQQYGQGVATFLAPVGEITSVVGNVFSGALKALSK